MKIFLLCSLLSLFGVKDASSARSLDCEVRAAPCSLSRDCQYSYHMTVIPDSNVTLNCSVRNNRTTLGMTWEQVNKALTASYGLVLKQGNSTTRIYFTRELQLTFRSTSPIHVSKDQRKDLKCAFKGWPSPRVVWKRNDQPIINGSQGFFHTEKKLAEIDQLVTVKSTLRFPPFREEYEGYYSCIAENNINGWSSNKSSKTQVIFECPRNDSPVPESSEIHATAFTNKTLKCLVDSELDYDYECYLRWYFHNKSLPLKSDEKYKTRLKTTERKCENAFTLTIVNVTDNDEGTYSCHMSCEWEGWESTSAAIQLHVYPPQIEVPTISETTTISTQPNHPVMERAQSVSTGGSRRRWVLLITILTALGVFAVISFVVLRYVKKRRKSCNHHNDSERLGANPSLWTKAGPTKQSEEELNTGLI